MALAQIAQAEPSPFDLTDAQRAEVAEMVVESDKAWTTYYADFISRRTAMTALVEDHWQTVFPNDVSDTNLPMVSNKFREHIEDLGHLVGRSDPMTRSYPRSASPSDSRAAEKKEGIVTGYHNLSDLDASKRRRGMDLAAAGVTGIKVWPDFSKPIARRYPMFSRLDARVILPEPGHNPDAATERVIVTGRMTAKALEREYPDAYKAMMDRVVASKLEGAKRYRGGAFDLSKLKADTVPASFLMLDYFSTEYVCRVAVYEPAQGQGAEGLSAGVMDTYSMLFGMKNPTDYCPVQLALRSSWTLQPSGVMDSAKGIVLAKNRFFRLFLAYMVEVVHGGKIAWNIQNPTARGPGTVYLGMGPDAKMQSVAPEVSPQLGQVLALLDQEARSSSFDPASREGETAVNKASAAFLTAASAVENDLAGAMQDEYARSLERANEAAMAMDEAFCDADKTVDGKMRGRRHSFDYRPSKDIAGDYSNEVRYAFGRSMDETSQSILVLQKRGQGDLSLRTAIELDPLVDNADDEIAQIHKEQLEMSMFAMLNDPSTPPTAKALALAMFEKGKAISEIMEAITPIIEAAQKAASNPLAALAQQGPPGAQALAGGGGAPAGPLASVAMSASPGVSAPGVSLTPRQVVMARARK